MCKCFMQKTLHEALTYKFIHRFFNIYTTYLHTLFHFIPWSEAWTPALPIWVIMHTIKIFFAYPLTFMFILLPFILVLCKSLTFDLIDTKFGTLFHLFMVCSSNDLYCSKLYCPSCTAYFTRVIGNYYTSCHLHIVP